MKQEVKVLKKITFDVPIPNMDGDGIAQTIQIEVETYTDPASGEDILTPESMELIEKTQARHMGLMSAGELKELRVRLGLSQDQMSELLQIGGKSYTRWESGRAHPSRSMNVMLCALRDGQLDVNYLEALRAPDTHAVWVARQSSPSDFTSWCASAPIKQVKHGKLPPEVVAGMASWEKHFPAGTVFSQSEKPAPSKTGSRTAPSKSKTPGKYPRRRLPPEWQQREICMNYMKTNFDPKQPSVLNIG